MRQNLFDLRGDAMVALAIPLGCSALLLEAYTRTELQDAEGSTQCRFSATSALIKPSHVRQLEKEGIVTIPNALSAEQLKCAREDVMKFAKSKTSFHRSMNDTDVRQDMISWVRVDQEEDTITKDSSSSEPHLGNHLSHCVKLIRGVASALEENGYVGSCDHMIPQQCQLALYPGDDKSVYRRHLDRCNESIYDLGLLEWLRLSDYRERALTVILYLNLSDRQEHDGGALQCWVRDESAPSGSETGVQTQHFHPPVTILPKGGTLVIFQSALVEHMVLPSSTDRYALTSWVSGTI
jgi:hypothetical protein